MSAVAVITFVRTYWKLAALGVLCLLLAVQTVRIEGLGIWPIKIAGLQDKYDTALQKLITARAELERISSKKNEQAERSGENIKKAETIRTHAEREAEKIERAPVAPDCSTPPEIMGADL